MPRLNLLAVIFVLLTSPLLAQGWKAAAAKATITPQQPLWMAGYASRDKPATGKATELYAKALALQDAKGKTCLLLTFDLIGLDSGIAKNMTDGITAATGIPRDCIALNCSHTHSGPVVAQNLRPIHYLQLDAAQQKLLDEYADKLVEQTVALAKEALSKLSPARVEWGVGKATFAVNRRNNKEADVAQLREKGLLVGPFDHDVPVLAVRSPEGKLLAATFGYACHATVLPFFDWSGDYPGYAQAAFEEQFPEAIGMFWAGCGGDQNPLPRRDVELAKKYGGVLATSVKAVIDAPMHPLTGELKVQYKTVPVAYDRVPTKADWEKDAAGSDKYAATRANHYLELLAAGKETPAAYDYPVQVWNLGSDVEWVFLGGEVVIDYALRIKAENRGKQTWVAGYSNDVMAYIPSRRVLTEGGYEGAGAMVYYGLPSIWGPEVENTIMAEVTRQLKP